MGVTCALFVGHGRQFSLRVVKHRLDARERSWRNAIQFRRQGHHQLLHRSPRHDEAPLQLVHPRLSVLFATRTVEPPAAVSMMPDAVAGMGSLDLSDLPAAGLTAVESVSPSVVDADGAASRPPERAGA